MSNTRHAKGDGPQRQERFASSQEFERGLMANLVARRCAILTDPADRELIWFLQFLSHQEGGLRGIVDSICSEIKCGHSGEKSKELVELSRGYTRANLEKDIEELCLNPESRFTSGKPWYFPDLVSELRKVQATWIAEHQRGVAVTSIGQKVHDALDYALEAECLVLVDGVARTGKTFAAKAWCNRYPGRVRYVQVPSSNDDIGFFRAIARSLGVSINLNSKAQELRQRIEETLHSGELMLVLDEAHYLWPQSHYRHATPGRVNWIMTALVNFGVPLALITTPQFMRLQKEIEARTCWTGQQFTGRIGHYEPLPDTLTAADLAAVAKSFIPEGDARSIQSLVLYAQTSSKYLAGIEAVSKRARFLATRAGESTLSYKHIKQAIQESVIPSDRAFAEAMEQHAKPFRKKPRAPFATPLQPAFTRPATPVPSARSVTPVRAETPITDAQRERAIHG